MGIWYGDKRKAKVNICHSLMNKGWKIYGYTEDQSDSMTDYYSPAHWDGIATKNGFTLIIDSYGNSYSGKEIVTVEKSVNYSKIQKLEALRDDKGASKGEKANAQRMIDKMYQEAEKSKKVVDTYPEYMSTESVGKTVKWHIEKDGDVVAKGNGIYKFYQLGYDYNCYNMEWNSRERWTGDFDQETGCRIMEASKPDEEQQKLIDSYEKFINKLESVVGKKFVVGDGTQATEKEGLQAQESEKLVKVTKTRKKTVKKLVELPEVKDIRNAEYFKLVSGFTYGCSAGTVYKFKCGQFGQSHRMNRKLTKVLTGSSTPANRFSGDYETINKWIAKGSIVACAIVDDTEIEEYEVWEAVKTEKKIEPKQNKTTSENNTEVQEVSETTVTFNEEKQGIEIRFAGIPSEEIRNELKANGFRWSRKQKMWYAKDTEERRVFVNTLQSSDINTQETPKKSEEKEAGKQQEETQQETPEATATEVRHNKRMNGIEIEFDSEPNEIQKQKLKQLQFRYHKSKNMWYTKYDENKMEFAEGLKAG